MMITLLACLLGAWAARINGGGKPRLNRWVSRFLCMAPFVVGCWSFAHYYSFLALIGMVGIATGHGLYFLAMLAQYTRPEGVDFIVKKLFGTDPRTLSKYKHLEGISWDKLSPMDRKAIKYDMFLFGESNLYWRCVFGMFLTGTLVGLPAAIVSLCFGEWYSAVFFSLTGVAKALAYMLGQAIFKRTEESEMMNGFFRTFLALIRLGA